MTNYDHLTPEQAAGLPTGPDRIRCAAPGCRSFAEPHRVPIVDGHPVAPERWGEIELCDDLGNIYVIFTCSPACERRIAASPPSMTPTIPEPDEEGLWLPE